MAKQRSLGACPHPHPFSHCDERGACTEASRSAAASCGARFHAAASPCQIEPGEGGTPPDCQCIRRALTCLCAGGTGKTPPRATHTWLPQAHWPFSPRLTFAFRLPPSASVL